MINWICVLSRCHSVEAEVPMGDDGYFHLPGCSLRRPLKRGPLSFCFSCASCASLQTKTSMVVMGPPLIKYFEKRFC